MLFHCSYSQVLDHPLLMCFLLRQVLVPPHPTKAPTRRRTRCTRCVAVSFRSFGSTCSSFVVPPARNDLTLWKSSAIGFVVPNSPSCGQSALVSTRCLGESASTRMKRRRSRWTAVAGLTTRRFGYPWLSLHPTSHTLCQSCRLATPTHSRAPHGCQSRRPVSCGRCTNRPSFERPTALRLALARQSPSLLLPQVTRTSVRQRRYGAPCR
mmetsp:Transcript_11241/g.35687  ORF Transcript_11241/g.35687 Transcript_11241/m.35687 type:complete len:210 (-) Transcript_11241:184-813(-)